MVGRPISYFIGRVLAFPMRLVQTYRRDHRALRPLLSGVVQRFALRWLTDAPIHGGERWHPSIGLDMTHVDRYQFALTLLTDKDSVLDIACGTGYGTQILSALAGRVTGVDMSPDAIAFATRQHGGRRIRYAVSDLRSWRSVADVVVSFETVEHVPARDVRDTVKRLAKLARRLVVASVPFQEPAGVSPYHVQSGLDEARFKPPPEGWTISFRYQYPDGSVHGTKSNNRRPQTLIFLLDKHEDGGPQPPAELSPAHAGVAP